MTLPTQVDPFDVGRVEAETGIATVDVLAHMADAVNAILQTPRRKFSVGRFTGLSKTGVGIANVLDLRDSTLRSQIAVAYTPDYDGEITLVYVELGNTGAPAGNVWASIQGDASNKPNKIDYGLSGKQVIVGAAGAVTCYPFVFNPPIPVKNGQKVWLVMNGDYAVDGVNYTGWMGITPVTVGDTTASFNSGTGAWGAVGTTLLVRSTIYEQISVR